MSETPDIWREIGPAIADAVAEARWPAGEGARILGPDGQPVALEQADMFPPVRIGPMDGEIAPDAVDRAMRFAMATMEVTLATMGLPTPVDPDRRDQAIAELRAVLAPLLDDPYVLHEVDGLEYGETETEPRCVFCLASYAQKRSWTGRLDARGRKINEDADATPHKPDCPVLRADELLGR